MTEGRRPVVMVVDDDKDHLFVVREILEEQFLYKVVAVESAKEALERTQVEPPDLFLLDIMMEEMDGITLCRTIKGQTRLRNIPVIFITAMDDFADVLKGLNAGAEDYIKKPYLPLELYARCQAMLRMKERFDAILRENEALRERLKAVEEGGEVSRSGASR